MAPSRWIMLLTSDETHLGYTFTTGVNALPPIVDPTTEFCPHGFHFYDRADVAARVGGVGTAVVWWREVTLPTGAPPPTSIPPTPDARYAPTVVLGARHALTDLDWDVYDVHATNGRILPFTSEALCVAAMATAPWTLCQVPVAWRTAGACATAVSACPQALGDVPEGLKTPAMCDTAVAAHPLALRFVPPALKTVPMCTAAVGTDPWALEHTPDALKTQAMCDAAVTADPWVLSHVPDALKTQAMCDAAVAAHPFALAHTPDALKTHAMCAAAVAVEPNAIRFVPAHLLPL